MKKDRRRDVIGKVIGKGKRRSEVRRKIPGEPPTSEEDGLSPELNEKESKTGAASSASDKSRGLKSGPEEE